MQLLYVITITLPHPRLPNTCFPLFCYSVFCPCPQAFDSPTPPCTGCCSSNSSPISLVTDFTIFNQFWYGFGATRAATRACDPIFAIFIFCL
ncbi:hypothetical protein V6Z11_D13G143800 [Gossypium hirsutum]